MKKSKCEFLILILIVTYLFYKADFLVAMAAEQNVEFVMEAEPKPGPIEEPSDKAEAGPVEEKTEEPSGEVEPGLTDGPIEEPPAEAEPGLVEELIGEPSDEAEPESAEGPIEELPAEAEPGLSESTEESVEPVMEPSVNAKTEWMEEISSSPDSGESVSTGQDLIEWLESHKNTGGTVKLTDHVVLDETYIFCPDGMNKPVVSVDTDIYTITVTGVAEFMSDNHLIFSGQPEGKGLFYVAKGGTLSLSGIAVESSRCALWQEEGAGLVEEDCHISGSIHYADMPFVTDMDSPCIVVEKGQTLKEVLPEQIDCTVNRQGRLSQHESVLLSWNLEGTERQQKERRRFQLKGSFLHVLSAEPVQCTVVYNDYPLTFMDVKASIYDNLYLFQGWYTKSQESQSIKVISEYSFDGKTWFMSEETEGESFFIFVPAEKFDRAAQPNIYIRLRWNDNGVSYFSNVLRYSVDNLDYAEDIGGSRGGGTSIVNPPDEPQKSDGGLSAVSSDPEAGVQNIDTEGAVHTQDPNVSDEQATFAESKAVDNEQTVHTPKDADNEQTAHADPELTDEGRFSNTESRMAADGQPANPEQETMNREQVSDAGLKYDNNVKNSPARKENVNRSVALAQVKEQKPRSDIRRGSQIAVVAGAILLSVIVGIASFYVHSWSGTNR